MMHSAITPSARPCQRPAGRSGLSSPRPIVLRLAPKHQRDQAVPDMKSGFAPRGYRNGRRGTSLSLGTLGSSPSQKVEPHEGEGLGTNERMGNAPRSDGL
jgi:hypothetical protein